MPAPQGAYGAYNAYISAATRYAALGAPTLYDHPPHPGPVYGSKSNYKLKLSAIYISRAIIFLSYCVVLGGESARGLSKKVFVGRLPQEATAEDLRQYFGRFGRILDVYVPRVS